MNQLNQWLRGSGPGRLLVARDEPPPEIALPRRVSVPRSVRRPKRRLNTADRCALCRLGRRTQEAPPLRAERVDRDLVEQAQRGDQEAFAILARTRGDQLFGVARRVLREVDLAEDAVQQALVIA